MLDLINLDGGNNGRGRARKTPVENAGVRSIPTRGTKDNTPETRAALALYAAMNTLTWNPAWFAAQLVRGPIVIQKRVLGMLFALIDSWSLLYDEGAFEAGDSETFDFLVRARQMKDALSPFR